MSRGGASFHFSPFSKKQLQILTWWLPQSPVYDKDILIADGAVRSGKTISMALSFVLWSMITYNGQNLGMAGKTIKSFERNVLRPLKQMLHTLKFHIVEHRADNMIEIVYGRRRNEYYIFGGKDERSQDLIQGITLAGLLLDEVALMPQSFVNQATARCSVEGSRMYFNCNPEGPAHWFYQEYIKKDPPKKNVVHLHFTMDDNLSLSPAVKQRYKELYSGMFYDRFILGRWSVAEGAVYGDVWSDDLLFDDGDLEIGIRNNKRYKRYILIDYGIVNPTVYLDVIDDGKIWWVMDEWYYGSKDTERQMTVAQLADALKTFIGSYELKPRYLVIDPSATALKAELRNRHLGAVREIDAELVNANNRVLEGIQKVASCYKKGLIRVHKRCKHFREEVTSYIWDSDAIAKGQEEKVVKLNDHTQDALRYGVHTLLSERRIFLA